ncbi:glutamine synthetase family protein [Aeromicrobium sp. P5_D10]
MSSDAGLLTRDEYEQLVAEGQIDTVICATPDMHGRLMGKRLTTAGFSSLGLSGEGIAASSYLFTSDIDMTPMNLPIANEDNGWPDFHLVPDLATFRRVPWESNAALVLCDARSVQTGALMEVAPRSILRRQLARARELDLAFKFASELEFYLATVEPAAAHASGYRDLPMSSQYRGDYQILQSSRDEWFIHQIRTLMPQFGIPIESSKVEWGLGQQEITLDYCDALQMADRHVLFKHGIKELAQRNSLTATFMAKPSMDDAGSSCHLHTSLWSADGSTPLDWSDGGMSDVFGSYVSGQLAHTLDVGLMYAPTINSYKRYVPDQFAGTALVVGHDNRTCAFRLVGEGDSYRLENRIPGADTNPYLAYAGTIAAGLAGITAGVGEPRIYTGNAYRDGSLPLMPSSLHESLAHFADSKIALDAFGPEVHEHLRGFYANELRSFDSETVTDWERQRYYDRI